MLGDQGCPPKIHLSCTFFSRLWLGSRAPTISHIWLGVKVHPGSPEKKPSWCSLVVTYDRKSLALSLVISNSSPWQLIAQVAGWWWLRTSSPENMWCPPWNMNETSPPKKRDQLNKGGWNHLPRIFGDKYTLEGMIIILIRERNDTPLEGWTWFTMRIIIYTPGKGFNHRLQTHHFQVRAVNLRGCMLICQGVTIGWYNFSDLFEGGWKYPFHLPTINFQRKFLSFSGEVTTTAARNSNDWNDEIPKLRSISAYFQGRSLC